MSCSETLASNKGPAQDWWMLVSWTNGRKCNKPIRQQYYLDTWKKWKNHTASRKRKTLALAFKTISAFLLNNEGCLVKNKLNHFSQVYQFWMDSLCASCISFCRASLSSSGCIVKPIFALWNNNPLFYFPFFAERNVVEPLFIFSPNFFHIIYLWEYLLE